MNPYQQPYGPPGYGMPPPNNYNFYGSGYQGYGGMPPAPPGVPYTVQGGAGYPTPPMQQESSYTGYPTGGYYNSSVPYGTAPPYGAYPQSTYSGPPFNPYGQTSAAYNPYPGQYDQPGPPVSTVSDSSSYPASTVSYGYASGHPYPATSSCPPPDTSSGYPMPSTSSYDPYPSTSGSYSGNQVSTTVTDSIAVNKPDSPLPPTLPYGESADEKSRWRDDPLADLHRRRGSPSNWHTSSSDALPTPKHRGRANTPTGEMGDKAPGKGRREELPSDAKHGAVQRQTTADEWNEIADIIKEEKSKGRADERHMDPKQLSGISEDDPVARADYKRKLNALANLMTDVNLDEPKK